MKTTAWQPWFVCDACGWGGFKNELDSATVADDGDQMNGRPFFGEMDIAVCPHCGSEEIAEVSG